MEQQRWWQQRAAWLHASLEAGRFTGVTVDGPAPRDVPLRLVDLGPLELSTGALVVADPYLLNGPEPLRQRLVPGTWQVQVAEAEVQPGSWRVAAALLVRGDAPVAWEMALVGDQDPRTLGEDEHFGYAVDTGTGCFADLADAPALEQVLDEDAGMLEDDVSRVLEQSALRGGVVAPRPGAGPVAVFSSGWGDGVYPTWLGRDASGEVVVVVTDFLLVDDPFASDEPPEPVPAPSRWQRLVGVLRR